MRLGSLLLSHLLLCLRFLTRLPLPEFSFESAPHGFEAFARALWLVPAVGALLGLLAAFVLVLASISGLPPALAAPLAIGALILLSGGLHEDGLADCADAFGATASRERKLEIMKDSRIGAFAALALALSLYLRVVSLASIAGRSLALASAVLLAAAALSRAAALIPLAALSPARAGGAGFSAGAPKPLGLALGAGFATLFALVPLWAGAEVLRGVSAIALGAAAAVAVAALAKRQIGGQTGDVAGAAQQICEIAVYLVYAAGSGSAA